MAANPVFPDSIKNPVAQLQNADSTNFVTVYTPGSSGSKIESLSATNTDTGVATVLQFAVTKSSVDYVIGEVSIAAGAGTNGSVKAIDVLNSTDLPWIRSDGINKYLYLESGSVLKAKAKVAVAGVNKIQLFGQAGDY